MFIVADLVSLTIYAVFFIILRSIHDIKPYMNYRGGARKIARSIH